MSISTTKDRSQAKPGAVLKAIRARRGWTLADVSHRTGLTVSALSKVENDKIGLNFEKLVRLCEGLEIDVAQLFGSAAEDQPARVEGAMRRSVTRAGEGRSVEVEGSNYVYLATELLHKRMIPILGEVFKRDIAEYEELLHHDGEEFVYVVEGTLELHTALYTPVRLESGDSVYFDSAMGHAYVSVGDGPCRILSINATSEAHVARAIEQRAPRKAGPARPPVRRKAPA
ncbi:helix-turn-helix domain-containing protein [Sphingomonas bacterium]|uniref:helix-turn-helix domain-containing protein n=1 Tax=Sphingomonas bacterium TaxID=1895847 RepID=UPI00157518D3|nr:XRE family transcriptional regulator [Sphingomonas bacterium]